MQGLVQTARRAADHLIVLMKSNSRVTDSDAFSAARTVT